MRLLSIISLLLLTNCQHNPPHINPCSIINPKVSQCNPTDPSIPTHDKEIKDMRGWTCFSPRDQGAVKKYINEELQKLEFGLPFKLEYID